MTDEEFATLSDEDKLAENVRRKTEYATSKGWRFDRDGKWRHRRVPWAFVGCTLDEALASTERYWSWQADDPDFFDPIPTRFDRVGVEDDHERRAGGASPGVDGDDPLQPSCPSSGARV